jgi:NADH:ubiquinone oxidoreductase subunit 2 (subunit N)
VGVRAILRLITLSLKKLLGYSSIFISVWLLLGRGQLSLVGEYLLAYILGLVLVIRVVEQTRGTHLREMGGFNRIKILVLMGALLRIRGIPPLLGFFVKLEILYEALNLASWVVLISLVGGSMIYIYVYMRVFYLFLAERWDSAWVSGASEAIGG